MHFKSLHFHFITALSCTVCINANESCTSDKVINSSTLIELLLKATVRQRQFDTRN